VSFYIYYRVASPAGIEAAVLTMQSELDAILGVRGRLLQKSGEPGLWMEIYEGVPDDGTFLAELERLVEAHGLAAFLAPGSIRKIERFEERCA
jgi:hypothetical protein